MLRAIGLRWLWLTAMLIACSSSGGPKSMPSDASDNGRLTIERPLADSILTTQSVMVEGVAELSDDSVTAVMVNGTPLPIENGRFQGRVTVDEGPARIEASVLDLQAHVNVLIDSRSPEILIESPAPGSFVEGLRLRVSGRVVDTTLEEITLNGEPVPFDSDGEFSVRLDLAQGAHRFRLAARDRANHTTYAYTSAIVGSFAGPGELIADATSFRLGPDAIRVLEDGAEQAIGALDMAPYIEELNPVLSDWWGEAYITGETHLGVEVALVPQMDRLGATVTVLDVSVDFDIHTLGTIIPGQVTASHAAVTAPIRVWSDAGLAHTAMEEVSVTLQDFRFATDWTPQFAEDWEFVRNLVRAQVEAGIRDAVLGTLPTWLETNLSELPQIGIVELGDVFIDVRHSLESLSVDPDGIVADFDVAVSPLSDEVAKAYNAPGSVLMVRTAPPELHAPNVGAVAALDLFNSIIYAGWASGGYRARIEEIPSLQGDGNLTVQDLILIMPSLRELAPETAPVALIADTVLPPVLEATRGGEELVVDIVDTKVEAVAVVDDQDVHLFTLSIAAEAPVELVLADDVARAEFSAPVYTSDVIDGPPRILVGPELDEFLAEPLRQATPYIFDLSELPMPTLLDFHIRAPESRTQSGYVTFQGQLQYSSSADDASDTDPDV